MTRHPHTFSLKRLLGAAFAVLIMVMLVACDLENNFFYHPVEFKGEVEEAHMVITTHLRAGEAPVVRVGRSFFFMDSTAVDTVRYTYEDADGPIEIEYLGIRGYLRGATVEMQVGDGPWETLIGREDSIVYRRDYDYVGNAAIEHAYGYYSTHVLSEGDLVNIRVTHPDFKQTATASQRIPRRAGAKLLSVDTLRAPKALYTEWLLNMDVEIPEYQGADDDVMCFTATSYVTRYFNTTYCVDLDSLYNPIYRDTTYSQLYMFRYVFARGAGFERYDNINEKLSLDYWGSNQLGLYRNANRYGTEIDIPIKMCYSPWEINYYGSYGGEDSTYYMLTRTDSVVLDVRMVSRAAYLQMASMVSGGYRYVDVQDIWGSNTGGSDFDLDDIINEIQDAFAELGNLEGVQVYGNVTGGYGHVTSEATDHIVFIPGQPEVRP